MIEHGNPKGSILKCTLFVAIAFHMSVEDNITLPHTTPDRPKAVTVAELGGCERRALATCLKQDTIKKLIWNSTRARHIRASVKGHEKNAGHSQQFQDRQLRSSLPICPAGMYTGLHKQDINPPINPSTPLVLLSVAMRLNPHRSASCQHQERT